MNTTYQIERVSTIQGMEALAAPWAELVAGAPNVPVFLTHEWILAWCRHMDAGWKLWVLAAWDEDGCLAGVAPLVLRRHDYGPFHIDRLAFMGDNYSYRTHQDIIAREGEREAVARAFVDYLLAQRGVWDVIDLEALVEGSPVKAVLADARGHFVEKEPIACPYTPLPDTWEDYELQQLSANRRQQLRARRRKLERDFAGHVVFERVRDAAGLTKGMDNLIELHRKRWHGRGQASSFDIESFEAFHRELAALAIERDWLRLYLLRVDDQAIAAEYCFYHDGVLFDYQKGFDPDPRWERYSPGQLVQAFAIQDAIAEGGREFDMARGTYEYKYSWTHEERVDSHVALSVSVAGYLWLAGGQTLARAKERAARLLPGQLRQHVNRMLAYRRSSEASPASGDPAGIS